jgi:hypothetical protein
MDMPVTDRMLDEGVGALIDYEIGGVTAREAVKAIFSSMIAASDNPLSGSTVLPPDAKGPVLCRQLSEG